MPAAGALVLARSGPSETSPGERHDRAGANVSRFRSVKKSRTSTQAMPSRHSNVTLRQVTRITPRSTSFARHLDPVGMARQIWRHRDLIRQFTRRELEGRYRGSLLGLFWSFLQPLSLLAIYTFVSGVVFRTRSQGSTGSGLGEFALWLFCGLVAFNILAECVGRAGGLVASVPNYVKKVVFPLEVLPLAILGSAMFHAVASFVVLLVFTLVVNGSVPWTATLLPLAALPLVFLTLGLTWLLASLGVLLRDLIHAIPLAMQILFFATPIIYPIERVPDPVRTAMAFNPLAFVVEGFRRLIFQGLPPDWTALLLWTLATFSFMLFGYAWFMKSKKAFADLL
jgi:lipopolysaccharide transport system permease protein